MPSYVIHLACAGQILKYCKLLSRQDENQFYIGSIAADMVHDKKNSHFWDDRTYQYLERKPNLSMFLERYGARLHEPYIFGYYTHLYLDSVFLEQYWDRHFAFYDAGYMPETDYNAVRYVKVAEQNRMYDREQFFSKALYYGDYDRMNPYFARKYALDIPDTEQILSCKEAYSAILEIDWEESLPILNDTLLFLQQSVREEKKENIKPPLKIFLLPELETMIDSAAKEMARCYA